MGDTLRANQQEEAQRLDTGSKHGLGRRDLAGRLVCGSKGVTDIARRHQISRKALYRGIQRHEDSGAEGLADRSRAPTQVDLIWRERVNAVRQQHALGSAQVSFGNWSGNMGQDGCLPLVPSAGCYKNGRGQDWPMSFT
jgi:hypothetical protein